MIDEKKILAEELNKYIKLEKTQEECTGFIDGFEKALEVVKKCSIPLVSNSACKNCGKPKHQHSDASGMCFNNGFTFFKADC